MARPQTRPARAVSGGMGLVPAARYPRSNAGDALENAKATRAGSPPVEIEQKHISTTESKHKTLQGQR